MSASLSLVRLRPDMAALARWGANRGFLPRDVDAGYCLHAATRAALGELAPRPFVLHEHPRREPELLGYAPRPAAELAAAAALPAVHDPDASSALGLSRLEARDMPTDWGDGRRLGFALRARPVARTREGRDDRRGEVDVALWARARDPAAEPEAAYLAWLADRLAPGARLLYARVEARRSVRVLRRPGADGGRRARIVPGPEVAFRGVLEVADAAGFACLVSHGVGRHRAFGFGCLLLSPPGAL